MIKYPCRGCIYFNACGEFMRTMSCSGRVTKAQKKAEEKKNGNEIRRSN